MSLIAIIVPVYNVEPFLRRCVDSILVQTIKDFELILVDDGSPDGCPAICDEYKEKDNRVVVIHQKNGGLSAARNSGIDWAFANSDSQWLTFIDSDDWVHPMYLELLYKAANENDCSISLCQFQCTDGENPVVDDIHIVPQICKPERVFLEDNTLATIACGKLYCKQLFLDNRYPVGKIHEDVFLTHRLLFQTTRLAVLNVPLYAYYSNPNGITRVAWSSKRMDELEAFYTRLMFFECKNEYQSLWMFTLKQIDDWYRNVIQNECTEIQKYKNGFKKDYRYFLLKYRKEFSFSNNKWRYEIAFPKFMQIYWRMRGIASRIKRAIKCVRK